MTVGLGRRPACLPGLSTGASSAIAAGRIWADLVRYAVLSSHRSGIHADRLLESIGHIPPAECEANYYRRPAEEATTVV